MSLLELLITANRYDHVLRFFHMYQLSCGQLSYHIKLSFTDRKNKCTMNIHKLIIFTQLKTGSSAYVGSSIFIIKVLQNYFCNAIQFLKQKLHILVVRLLHNTFLSNLYRCVRAKYSTLSSQKLSNQLLLDSISSFLNYASQEVDLICFNGF